MRRAAATAHFKVARATRIEVYEYYEYYYTMGRGGWFGSTNNLLMVTVGVGEPTRRSCIMNAIRG